MSDEAEQGERQPQEADSPDVKERARAFVRCLVNEDVEQATAMFDVTMRTAMPSSALVGLWQGLTRQLGEFVDQEGVELVRHAEYQICFVTCRFERDAMRVKLVFDAASMIAGLFVVPATPPPQWSAPEYADPRALVEEEMTLGEDPWVLPGTLTLPTHVEGAVTGVVLVHGSGPNDRDETLGPSKVFKDLAWGLATAGFAVLRYDKRTLVHGAAMAACPEPLTVQQETVDDAVLAAAWLGARDEVDRVVVIGHSLGAMLAPRIAAAAPEVAAMIALAPGARPLEDMSVEQVETIINLNDHVSEVEAQKLAEFKAARDKIKQLTQDDAHDKTPVMFAPPAYWLALRGFMPHQEASALSVPVLVLQGERDYQVTMVDFEMWRAALAGHDNATLKSFPALNHLFIAGEGPSRPEEYAQLGHVCAEVLETIKAWLGRQGL